MGGTGGEGFLPPFSRMHPLNGNVDEEVRNKDGQESEEDIEANDKENNQCADARVGARESQEWGNVAEKMINHVRTTEGESKGVCCVDGSIEEATDIGANSQEATHSCRHGSGVMKRSTHSCMTVIGHGGQEIALNSGKTHEEEELSSTAIVGDDFVSRVQCRHHLRSNG